MNLWLLNDSNSKSLVGLLGVFVSNFSRRYLSQRHFFGWYSCLLAMRWKLLGISGIGGPTSL